MPKKRKKAKSKGFKLVFGTITKPKIGRKKFKTRQAAAKDAQKRFRSKSLKNPLNTGTKKKPRIIIAKVK